MVWSRWSLHFLPCLKRSRPRAYLSFFVFSLFPQTLFPSDQHRTVCPPLPVAYLSSSTELSFSLCHSVDICTCAQLIAPSDLHLTPPQAIPPWIIHVIDVWTRLTLFLATCSPTLLTLILSVTANHIMCRNLLLFAWPSLHHHNRNFSSIASGVRLLQQAFVFAPVARPDLKNLYLDPTLVPLLIHYPQPPHPTIPLLFNVAPRKPPYHPPLLDQAHLPHPVQLHYTTV